MRHSQCLLIVAVLSPMSAAAQDRTAWFAGASFGPVMQDRQGNSQLRSSGVVINARAGRRLGPALSALMTLTHTSVAGKYETAEPVLAASLLSRVPCPEGDPLPCGPDPFVGPVKALIAAAGLEASIGGGGGARAFASLAPGVYWQYQRAPQTRPAAAGIGIGAGGSVRLMAPVWLVLHLQYHQVFSSGASPRWLVPIGLGIQVAD